MPTNQPEATAQMKFIGGLAAVNVALLIVCACILRWI